MTVDDSQHFIYFIQRPDGGPVKIGMSMHPTLRCNSLGQKLGEKLVIRRKVQVHKAYAAAMERNIHKHFESQALGGEWFEPNDELINLGHLKGFEPASA